MKYIFLYCINAWTIMYRHYDDQSSKYHDDGSTLWKVCFSFARSSPILGDYVNLGVTYNNIAKNCYIYGNQNNDVQLCFVSG